jgi:D-glycero-D-manno-heptose 1,7-bisphosphate phosphatase
MRLIILDRDGVINQDSDDFIKSPAEWIPIPGSLEAIAQLTRANYHVAVATNQSGIARKLFDLDTLMRIHQKMHRAVADVGGLIDAVLFCPHGPKDDCECRKPKPGMLREISARLHTDLANVPIVGDSLRDIQAAEQTNAQPIIVRTGKGRDTIANNSIPDTVPIYEDLADVVQSLLASTD